MKTFKIVFSLLFTTILFLTSCEENDGVQPNEEISSPLSAAYTERLNIVLDSVCNVLQIKGASAAILVPNVGIWKRAYGESHAGVPIRTDMTLTIGSNTKTYIATLILKLQEQDLLSINDTIGKWIKNKPYVNGQVTIKQLLNHTSGFGDFSFNPAFAEAIRADFNKVWNPEEMYSFLNRLTSRRRAVPMLIPTKIRCWRV